MAVVYAPDSYVTEPAEQIEAGVKDAGDIMTSLGREDCVGKLAIESLLGITGAGSTGRERMSRSRT